MNRRDLIERIRSTFISSDFEVASQEQAPGVSFDLVCRRDSTLAMVKVLEDAVRLTRAGAGEMRLISRLIGASPLLVASHRGGRRLDDGIAYLRTGIPLLTPGTLRNHLIEGRPPLIFSAPGGLYVRLDGGKLEEVRRARGLSRGALAARLGVSSRAVKMYEEGMSARVEVAAKMEEFSPEALILPLDPLASSPEADSAREASDAAEDLNDEVFAHLGELGYEVIPTPHCPFDAVARRDRGFFAGLDSGEVNIGRKARTMSGLARISDYYSVLFVSERSGRNCIEGTPLIDRAELRRIRHPEDILELIEERED